MIPTFESVLQTKTEEVTGKVSQSQFFIIEIRERNFKESQRIKLKPKVTV